jgi:autotransporter-associated beta strand protein
MQPRLSATTASFLRYPAFIALLLAALPAAQAANITWTGSSNNSTWAIGANWSGNVTTTASDIAVFNGGFTTQPTAVGSTSVGGLLFDTDNGNATVITTGTGLNRLRLSSGVQMNSGTGQVNLGLSGSGSQGIEITASQNWTNDSTSLLTANRVSVDNGASAGTYTLTINGSGSGGAAFPQVMGDVNNLSNATILLALAINTTGGNTTLSGNNTFSGGVTLTAGILQLGDSSAGAVGAVTGGPVGLGTLALNGGQISSNAANIRSVLNALTIGGNVTLGHATNSGTLTFGADADIGSSIRTLNTASAVTFSGNVTGTGGITKNGAGSLTYNGATANTYTGLTTASAGGLTLAKTAGNAIAGDLLVNGGGVSVTIAGTQIADTATVEVSSGNFTIGNGLNETVATVKLTGGSIIAGNGTSTLTAATLFDLQSGTSTAILAGAAQATKTTDGTVTLSRAGTYSGGTTLSAGILQIDVASAGSVGAITGSAIGTGPLALNGGTLSSATANNRTILNALTIGGDVTLGSTTNNGTVIFSADADLGGATRTLTTATGSGATFTGNIANGGIIKDGAGILILSGNSTYTGATTVSAGTLQIGAGGTSGSIATTSGVTNNSALLFNRSNDITAGYSISGTGTLTKRGNGTLTLSVANTYTGNTTVGAGTLCLTGNSTSAVALADGTVLQLDLASPVTSTSTLSFAGNNTVSIIGTPVAATTYNLFSGSAISGTPALSAAIEGFTLSNTGTVLQLVPSGGGGDTTKPIITLSGNATITVIAGTSYTDAGATATDETAPANPTVITTGTVNAAVPGVYILSYDAVDNAGNAALTVTRTVTVVDTTNPVITLSGNATVSIAWGATYADAGATATDETAPANPTVITSGTVNTAKPGTYVLSYNAVDAAGNAAITVTRTVTVAIANSTTVGADGYTPLMRYALGANGPSDTVLAPVLSSTSTTLVLTAVVRTDDPKLSVVGTTRTDLTTGTWATTGVSGSPAGSGTVGDQTGVTTGQRRVYTVTTASKTFLRLEATLAP